MGCDIHARVERKTRYGWLDSGDPDIGRNYEVYAVLANVRNSDGYVPIAEPRGLPETYDDQPHWEFVEDYRRWDADAHSAGWLSLAEMKAYDLSQTINDTRVIVGKEGDKITSVASSTTGDRHGQVGEHKVLCWPGEDEPTAWLRLLRYMDTAKFDNQTDEEIRLVFFFDN